MANARDLVSVARSHDDDTVQAVVSAVWHGVCHALVTTPWLALALFVPVLALLVRVSRRVPRQARRR